MAHHNKKVAVVTGTNTGIGLDIALALAGVGYHVYATVRSKAKATDLIQKAEEKKVKDHIELVELDVTSPDAPEALEKLVKHSGRIDVLVNNAGIGYIGSVESVSTADIQRQFDVNVFSVVRLTQAVLPTMRQQKSGYILNISSLLGYINAPFLGIYCATKHALESLTQILQMEVQEFGIKAILIEPGFTKSNFGANSTPNTKVLADDPYKAHLARNLEYIQKSAASAPPSTVVSDTVLKALNDPNPKARYQCTPDGEAVSRLILVDPAKPSVFPQH